MSKNEVRVIRWLAKGYEDAFTQYTITPDDSLGTPSEAGQYGRLFVVQISLRDNMARALQDPKPFVQTGTLAQLRALAADLIANRCEDGAAEEVVPASSEREGQR